MAKGLLGSLSGKIAHGVAKAGVSLLNAPLKAVYGHYKKTFNEAGLNVLDHVERAVKVGFGAGRGHGGGTGSAASRDSKGPGGKHEFSATIEEEIKFIREEAEAHTTLLQQIAANITELVGSIGSVFKTSTTMASTLEDISATEADIDKKVGDLSDVSVTRDLSEKGVKPEKDGLGSILTSLLAIGAPLALIFTNIATSFVGVILEGLMIGLPLLFSGFKNLFSGAMKGVKNIGEFAIDKAGQGFNKVKSFLGDMGEKTLDIGGKLFSKAPEATTIISKATVPASILEKSKILEKGSDIIPKNERILSPEVKPTAELKPSLERIEPKMTPESFSVSNTPEVSLNPESSPQAAVDAFRTKLRIKSLKAPLSEPMMTEEQISAAKNLGAPDPTMRMTGDTGIFAAEKKAAPSLFKRILPALKTTGKFGLKTIDMLAPFSIFYDLMEGDQSPYKTTKWNKAYREDTVEGDWPLKMEQSYREERQNAADPEARRGRAMMQHFKDFVLPKVEPQSNNQNSLDHVKFRTINDKLSDNPNFQGRSDINVILREANDKANNPVIVPVQVPTPAPAQPQAKSQAVASQGPSATATPGTASTRFANLFERELGILGLIP